MNQNQTPDQTRTPPQPKELSKLADIHQEALNRFDRIQTALRAEREQCVLDRRFYSIAGAQWEGPLYQQFENKPKLEINKVHLSVIRIINEYRNNRITVSFQSKDGSASDELADTCQALYRANEDDSDAEEAYDNAFEEAVGGGFGSFRLRAEYEDEYDSENERQNIKIEPIFDADSSVFFDLDAKKYDKSDATHAFVVSSMTIPGYIEIWGDDPASWPKSYFFTTIFDWYTPSIVYVVEYYCVELTKTMRYTYQNLMGQEVTHTEAEFELDPELQPTLLATGHKLTSTRKIKERRVHKYIMNGNTILEDCGYVVGKYIPIVPVYGKRWFVDNIERCMGHVRLAKDVQRIKNMQMSKLAEISALSSVEKPYFTPEQVAGHEVSLANDNVTNAAYQLLNPITDATGASIPSGPIGYTKVPNVPPAMATLLAIVDVDMKEILGNQEQGEQIVSHLSGKAVELVQNRLDMQTFIYMSNMAKSIKWAGKIWLSMAQEIYTEKNRKLKGVTQQDSVTSIEIKRPILDPKTKEVTYQNDMSKANFDVTVKVGPSSASKRESTVRTLMSMLQYTQDPETMQVITSMIMMNLQGEGLAQMNNYFRQILIRKGVEKPNEEERKQLEEEARNAQPDPQQQLLQAAAKELGAKATKAEAETHLTIAEISETKAKTMEILSGIKSEEQQRVLNAGNALGLTHTTKRLKPHL